jgi:hypothetical protein
MRGATVVESLTSIPGPGFDPPSTIQKRADENIYVLALAIKD